MKKCTSVMLSLLLAATSYAEQRMTIHGEENETEISVFQLKTIDLHDGNAYFNGAVLQPDTTIAVEKIDSLTFSDPIDKSYVQLIYLGDSVHVVNPYENNGLDISENGANVTVSSTLEDKNVTFYMKGLSENGSFVITPNKKFNMFLDNLLLSNPNGPAVQVMEDKEARFVLADGSINTLIGNGEATVLSETQVVFTPQLDEDDNVIEGGNSGSGMLAISSTLGHGISSSDYVRIEAGNILLTNVAGDGIHSNDYFEMNGGLLSMDSVMKDGIDCNDHIFINGGILVVNSVADDVKALKCDSMINILGGIQTITMTGKAAKGLKNDSSDIRIENATLNIFLSGDRYVSDSDISYCAGIKTEQNVLIKNSEIFISCDENTTGAKGINATKGISIDASTVTISADASKDGDVSGGKVACLKTDGIIVVSSDSNVTVSCANESEKGVSTVSAEAVDGVIFGYEGE